MVVRRGRRRRERLSHQVPVTPDDLTIDPSEALSAAVDDQPQVAALQVCLGQLAPRPRRILKLHYGLERSYAEIGDELGVSKQAVAKTVKKCLEALRRSVTRRTSVAREVA